MRHKWDIYGNIAWQIIVVVQAWCENQYLVAVGERRERIGFIDDCNNEA